MNGPGVVRPRQRQRTPTIQSYTIITVGQRCVGKSSLLRLFLDTLPLSPHATHDQLRSIANFVSSTNPFCECYLETLWDNERLLIHLIDTPPLNGDTLTETISLIEERYIRGARSDEDDESTIDDSHIHLCLYLLDALQHDFRPDIAAIGRLSVRVNVLPILARLISLKQSIRGRLADAGLGFGIFDKQGDDGIVLTPHSITGSPRTVPLLPYSIFSPEHSKLAYEPVLNLWMDKLDRRRADFQSLDNMKMDIDRKVDESTSTRFNPSLSSRNSVSPQPPAPELDVRKPDLTTTSVTQQDGELTPFPTTSSRKDEKSYPRTPPTADPSAPLPQTPSPSAVKDDPVRVESETKHSPSVPNPEETTQTEIEVKSSDSQTSGFVKSDDRSIQQRPSLTSSSSLSLSPSPQNAFGPEVKISPSSSNIPLKPSPCPVNCTEENHGRLICNNPPVTAPFSANDSELIAGKFVRVMRWGLLDCIDKRQSDFVRLRDEIMVWRKELKTYTREYLYSCFKDDSFSRLAAQAQQQQQQQSSRDILPEPSLHSHPRRESVSRDCAYRISPPPSLQHGLRGRSTSITESVAERDRPLIPRSVPSYSISRDRDSYPYEREKDLDGRYAYHDRSRENPPSPERERDYAHLSPSAGMIIPISNERKLSMSNGERERSKYRSPKHEHGWEDRLPVLPSIERDRYHRVSPNLHASPPSHSHPGPYPPQYNHHGHARDKEQFDHERTAREKISPLIRERDMITPPPRRSGSPGTGIPVPIGVLASQPGQGYGMNPNISPNMSAGGKQLDVHSLLNHNHHGAVSGQGLELGGREKEWERRERERDISPNPSTLGMSLSIPISNMPMSSGSAMANVVGTAGPSNNNTPVSVPNTALNAIGRKRKITMACNFCRSRKLKCDGVKPACAQCIKRGNTCDYQQHAVVPQGPPSAPKDPISQARDPAGQANVILHGTHVNGHLTSPGVRHREREHGRDAERDRDAPLYHAGRPYSPPPQGSSNPSSHSHSSYTPQSYSHPNYSRNREGSPPLPLPLPPSSQHHSNAPGATHTWRYTSQSHAQAHAAARDSDVDELMEDNSEHEDRDVDMRTRGIKSNRDFAHTVHEPSSNGSGGGSVLHSVNGRKRVSVDMLIVEALGEGSTREPVEEDGSVGPANNVGPTTAAVTAVRTGRDRIKERGKGQDVVQSQQGQPPPPPPPPPGQGGHYESGGPWYEMGMGVIDVGSEGDKKKRLNRQSANYGSKAVACVHCRARKTRCDAVRPACGNCARRSLSCSYNHVTPSQPRSKGKKAAAAAAATLTSGSNPSSISAGPIENKTDMGGSQRNSSTHLQQQQSHSPSVGRSPGQLGTTHGLPPSWHSQSHSSHSQSPLHSHPHGTPHSPIRIDDHRLPIEESAERERPLTRSPQPPIATLNVPERSRSRSSSGSLSINLMENGNGKNNNSNVTFNVNGTSIPVSRSRSTSNFAGPSIGELGSGTSGKRKSPDISGNGGEMLDGLSERGIIPERPDKRRKHWIENNSGESPVHLSNEVRVQ
ncbi:hypothetical protein Clacol_009817 [Clathrus columnatus]|uniref:Zn(2)-C6 fungal-type domain-containing protein n=1 Tax=Clathrus columnatus TaxID=1419009 RepID=A0AAV5ALQ2_9AGAM|nr:hypothetical protein Clacol_009817 [Clathrus columnatus]